MTEKSRTPQEVFEELQRLVKKFYEGHPGQVIPENLREQCDRLARAYEEMTGQRVVF